MCKQYSFALKASGLTCIWHHTLTQYPPSLQLIALCHTWLCLHCQLVYTTRFLAAWYDCLLLLLLYLPATAHFYNVVSQDVVTVAVVLEIHAFVGRDQRLACYTHRGVGTLCKRCNMELNMEWCIGKMLKTLMNAC